MSEYAIPKNDLLAALRELTLAYQRQNAVLSEISRTSEDIAAIIEQPDSTDAVDALIETRQRQCERLKEVSLPLDIKIDTFIREADHSSVSGAKNAQNTTDPRSGVSSDSLRTSYTDDLTQTISNLQSDSRSLMEGIMRCQAKCESVLRSRLDATAKAIGESVQKRRVNAAYSPAHHSQTPRYLDRQQ